MKFLFICILFSVSVSVSVFAESFESCKSPRNENFQDAKRRLSQKLLGAGLRYAREHSHPVTGFVEDTVDNYDDNKSVGPQRASISSTGFMMALMADLYKKQMISSGEAYAYCKRPLVAVLNKKKSDSEAAQRRKTSGRADPHTDISYKGWFSHFINWETGDRWIDPRTHQGVEYATTDSTWFLSGGIVCAEVFPKTDIPRLFSKIFNEVDFHDFMIDGGAQPEKRTLSMSFTPEEDDGALSSPGRPAKSGYSKSQWEIYQHSWLVYLLGMGAPVSSRQLPVESWAAWRRTGVVLNGRPFYGNKRALFSHYFPDVFMPPQEIKEACGIDYFRNSQVATLFNRGTALRDASSKTFLRGLWGVDAGPNPKIQISSAAEQLAVGTPENTRYGVNTPYKRNGTACPACAVAAIMFEPELILKDLRSWCDDKEIGPRLWGKYGPANGINLDDRWISPFALSGIVGPMALSVANLDHPTSVWKFFAKYPAVQRGLKAAAAAPIPSTGCLIPE